MKPLLKIVVAALMLMPAVMVSAWVLHRSFCVPENHIGFEPSLLLWAAGPSFIQGCVGSRGLRVLGWAMSTLTVGLVAVALHFNFLLQYEDWIQRGMPDKPTWATLWQR
nr:hypothetical protein [uncultured Aquabacterium sp.]